MKKQMLAVIACLAAGIMIASCSKNDKQQQVQPDPVSDEILAQINAYGLSTDNVRKTPDGYLVEGDILLTADQLKEGVNSTALRVGQVEQYRSSRLVTGLPRTITVKIVGLSAAFVAGVDTAIRRYNSLGLRITFQRITSGNAGITIEGFNQAPVNGYVSFASSGFPTSAGDPCPTIRLNYNAAAFGINPNVLFAGSMIQHEMGHCLGMHHTDYMDRSFSCGGARVREDITPQWIPGTPMGPDPDSWMLACSNGGNRPFNANDIIALRYLYR
ncbi:M57 family metalloprotease [Chitinophaga varians]|uniref:M57 family metalloprotease n=1 Tax=Chitinophaga varians TaxID=2202339 RepID=UPI00165FD079|nr:M57 family metalloprotease [Chitinophaga varians]MBC9915276.1 protease [Chitinophaga varians]